MPKWRSTGKEKISTCGGHTQKLKTRKRRRTRVAHYSSLKGALEQARAEKRERETRAKGEEKTKEEKRNRKQLRQARDRKEGNPPVTDKKKASIESRSNERKRPGVVPAGERLSLARKSEQPPKKVHSKKTA